MSESGPKKGEITRNANEIADDAVPPPITIDEGPLGPPRTTTKVIDDDKGKEEVNAPVTAPVSLVQKIANIGNTLNQSIQPTSAFNTDTGWTAKLSKTDIDNLMKFSTELNDQLAKIEPSMRGTYPNLTKVPGFVVFTDAIRNLQANPQLLEEVFDKNPELKALYEKNIDLLEKVDKAFKSYIDEKKVQKKTEPLEVTQTIPETTQYQDILNSPLKIGTNPAEYPNTVAQLMSGWRDPRITELNPRYSNEDYRHVAIGIFGQISQKDLFTQLTQAFNALDSDEHKLIFLNNAQIFLKEIVKTDIHCEFNIKNDFNEFIKNISTNSSEDVKAKITQFTETIIKEIDTVEKLSSSIETTKPQEKEDAKQLTEASPQAIAKDLKTYHLELIKQLKLSSFHNANYSKSTDPNDPMKLLTNSFEKLYCMVGVDILNQGNTNDRNNCYAKYVNIMDECIKQGNLFAAFALLHGLRHDSIKRLELDKSLSKEDAEKLTNAIALLDRDKNFKNAREATKALTQEGVVCVPIINVIASDITYAVEGNDRKSSITEKVNEERAKGIGTSVETLLEMQRKAASMPTSTYETSFIAQLNGFPLFKQSGMQNWLDDTLNDASKKIKPTTEKPPKVVSQDVLQELKDANKWKTIEWDDRAQISALSEYLKGLGKKDVMDYILKLENFKIDVIKCKDHNALDPKIDELFNEIPRDIYIDILRRTVSFKELTTEQKLERLYAAQHACIEYIHNDIATSFLNNPEYNDKSKFFTKDESIPYVNTDKKIPIPQFIKIETEQKLKASMVNEFNKDSNQEHLIKLITGLENTLLNKEQMLEIINAIDLSKVKQETLLTINQKIKSLQSKHDKANDEIAEVLFNKFIKGREITVQLSTKGLTESDIKSQARTLNYVMTPVEVLTDLKNNLKNVVAIDDKEHKKQALANMTTLFTELVKADSFGKETANVNNLGYKLILEYVLEKDEGKRQELEKNELIQLFNEITKNTEDWDVNQYLINPIKIELEKIGKVASERQKTFEEKVEARLESAKDQPKHEFNVDNVALVAKDMKNHNLMLIAKINPSELQHALFEKEKTRDRCPNLQTLITSFINLQSKVTEDVLLQDNRQSQIKVYEYYLTLIDESIKAGDYNSAMAIWQGLQVPPVDRLKCLSEINPQLVEKCNEFKELFDTKGNSINLRTHMANNANPLVITPVTILIKDLFAMENNPDRLNGGVNFDKLTMIGKVISQVQSLQERSAEHFKRENTQSIRPSTDFTTSISQPHLSEKEADARSQNILPRGTKEPYQNPNQLTAKEFKEHQELDGKLKEYYSIVTKEELSAQDKTRLNILKQEISNFKTESAKTKKTIAGYEAVMNNLVEISAIHQSIISLSKSLKDPTKATTQQINDLKSNISKLKELEKNADPQVKAFATTVITKGNESLSKMDPLENLNNRKLPINKEIVLLVRNEEKRLNDLVKLHDEAIGIRNLLNEKSQQLDELSLLEKGFKPRQFRALRSEVEQLKQQLNACEKNILSEDKLKSIKDTAERLKLIAYKIERYEVIPKYGTSELSVDILSKDFINQIEKHKKDIETIDKEINALSRKEDDLIIRMKRMHTLFEQSAVQDPNSNFAKWLQTWPKRDGLLSFSKKLSDELVKLKKLDDEDMRLHKVEKETRVQKFMYALNNIDKSPSLLNDLYTTHKGNMEVKNDFKALFELYKENLSLLEEANQSFLQRIGKEIPALETVEFVTLDPNRKPPTRETVEGARTPKMEKPGRELLIPNPEEFKTRIDNYVKLVEEYRISLSLGKNDKVEKIAAIINEFIKKANNEFALIEDYAIDSVRIEARKVKAALEPIFEAYEKVHANLNAEKPDPALLEKQLEALKRENNVIVSTSEPMNWKNPELVQAVYAYAKKEHSQENLDFLIEMSELRSIINQANKGEISPEMVYEKVRFIENNFFKEGAEHELNISPEVRAPLSKEDNTNLQMRIQRLNRAVLPIRDLIETDTYKRFQADLNANQKGIHKHQGIDISTRVFRSEPPVLNPALTNVNKIRNDLKTYLQNQSPKSDIEKILALREFLFEYGKKHCTDETALNEMYFAYSKHRHLANDLGITDKAQLKELRNYFNNKNNINFKFDLERGMAAGSFISAFNSEMKKHKDKNDAEKMKAANQFIYEYGKSHPSDIHYSGAYYAFSTPDEFIRAVGVTSENSKTALMKFYNGEGTPTFDIQYQNARNFQNILKELDLLKDTLKEKYPTDKDECNKIDKIFKYVKSSIEENPKLSSTLMEAIQHYDADTNLRFKALLGSVEKYALTEIPTVQSLAQRASQKLSTKPLEEDEVKDQQKEHGKKLSKIRNDVEVAIIKGLTKDVTILLNQESNKINISFKGMNDHDCNVLKAALNKLRIEHSDDKSIQTPSIIIDVSNLEKIVDLKFDLYHEILEQKKNMADIPPPPPTPVQQGEIFGPQVFMLSGQLSPKKGKTEDQKDTVDLENTEGKKNRNPLKM